ncbi:MAG: putative Ig domain-containing protein, partial [Microcoleus sp.]
IFANTYERTLTIPTSGSFLNISLANLNFDTSDTKSIKDAFEIALVDNSGKSLVHTISPGKNAFFNSTEGQQSQLASGVTFNGSNISVNLSQIAPGTTATLQIRLVNNDSDKTTQVGITSIAIQPASAATAPVTALPFQDVSPNAPVNFARLQDVSSRLGAEYKQTSFNSSSKILYADLAVKNTGQYPVRGTLLVAINKISDPTVRLLDADGITPEGIPYYDISKLVGGGILEPGELTSTDTLKFYNPQGVQFSYDLVFLSQLNQVPQFKATPNTEALVGKSYVYTAIAVDADGDALTYSLLEKPLGMEIDAQTGIISWNPVAGDIGNHAVTVQVEDGKGGIAKQKYVLSAINAPPNRPPIFTSTPVVDAWLKQPYRYQVQGKDDDGDTLTFNLVNAPSNMTLDPRTGLLTWTPSGNQRNAANVMLRAVDGLSGIAEQSFSILTQQQPGNNAPLIVSEPATQGYAGSAYSYSVRALDSDSDPLRYSLVGAPAGVVVDENTGVLTWNAPVVGSHNVAVRARDSRGGESTQSWSVNISNNQPGELRGTVMSGNRFSEIEVSVKATLTADNRYALYYGADDGASLKLVGIDTQNNWYGAETFNFTMPSDEHLYVVAWDEGSTQMLLAELSDNISLRTNTQDWEYIVSTNRSPSWPNVPPIAQLRDEISRSTWQIPQESAPNGSFPWGSFVSQGISQTARYIWHDSIYSNSSSDGFYAIFRSIDPVGARLRQPGAVVYIDANNNNRLDEGESSTTTDANGNYLFTLAPGTYTVATLLPPGSTQIVPSSETYQVSLASGQVLAGLDFRSAIGTRTFGNQNPVFTSTAPTTASAGQLVRYRPTATDADKNPLVYDLIVKPEGMAIDPQTGTVGWIPTAQQWGAHDFTIRVQDGYGGLDLQSSTITVKPGNERPHFTTIVGLNVTAPTGTVGQPLQIQFKAIDADFDPISYSLGTAPADAVIGTNTGIFTWTPTVSGSRTITVIARDGKGEETAQTFNLNVIASAPNTDPTITSTPRLYTGLGQAYFYNLQANDPYGDPLTYTLETAPAGMRIDSQGRVTWQPTTAFFGSNPVKISVEDGRGGVAEQEFILNVGSQNQNQPPSITSIPRQTATVQKLYQYDIAATDPDKDPLFWSLDAAPVGMSIDPETGKLRWNPSPDQIGTHDVALRVMDISGTYVGQAFTLNVRGVNVPPGIISTPPTLAAANKTYNYAVLARDAENDPLTFSLVSPPNGMTINPKTGLIQWTPSLSQVGVQNVGVLVSDSSEATASQQYALTISQTAINLPPAITSTPVFTASPGRPYSYQVTAADADGTISQYQLLQSPPGMTINSATGSITWNNPTAGNHQVVVGAVDNSGTGAAQGFELIARANSAAVVPTIPIQSVSPGASYRYDLKATDANGDLLTFALIQSPSGMTVDEFGRISWKPNAANIGNHPVEVKVTDTFGESVTVSYNLSVVADTSAPKVNIVASKNTANLGDSVTFTVNAVDNVKVESLGLTINGTPVVLDAQGQANVKVNNLGNFTAVATAKDAAGNVGNATQTVAAIDTSDVNAPTINISLEDDAEITAPFNITGTISDSNLAYYTLEVAPVGGGQIPGDGGGFKEVYRGTAAVSNGTVATFDPTVLANGAYVLKFTAIDTNGNGSTTERTVNVAGDLKLGNFRLSFTDLSVPVAGIPINVTRTYDSLNANASDDFGYGWRMEFRDTDLKTSLKADPTYEELGINTVPFDSKTKVFITLPGGKRETFTFKPTPHHLNQYLGGAGPGAQMFKPAFESHSGSTMTLTVKDANLVRNENGYYGVNAQPFNPENPAFGGVYVLTTKEGLIYEIDAKTGDLLTATDANGNKLTFSDAGIKSSSTGKSVTFERDVGGRIVGVVDPDGKKVKYEYDAKGDLVAVKDRENNATRFEYEAADRSALFD